MANDKINMAAFVQDIRDRQALDKPEQKSSVNTSATTGAPSPLGEGGGRGSKTGRPKKARKIEGGAPVTVFFDQDTKSKLVLTKVSHRIEMKDLIFGATLMFLDKYYDNGELSAKGLQELEKTLKNFYGE